MTVKHGLRNGMGLLVLLAACSSGTATTRRDSGAGGTGGGRDGASDGQPRDGASSTGGTVTDGRTAMGDFAAGEAGRSVGFGGSITGGSGVGGTGVGGVDGGGSGVDGSGLDGSGVDGIGSGGTTALVDAGADVVNIDGSAVDAPAVDVPVLPDAGVDVAVAEDGVVMRNTCVAPASAALANAGLPAGFCAWTWASGLGNPRGIMRNANGDLLVVEQTAGRITLLYDDDGNGVSNTGERVVLATTSGLNHGIAMSGGYLYASSDSTVYRWPYTGGRQPLGAAQTVVSGLPTGGHSTRTLLFDGQGRLYVAIGSGSNVDGDSSRAKIIRYAASALAGGATYDQGEVFAEGMRNEVGLTLDAQGRVWGVENGVDDLNRADLGGDIHNDNPGEELNLFAMPGRFYGYPYCWSEFLLPTGVGKGPGTQWLHPQFNGDGIHSDAWCQNTANVVAPVLSMQAHSAPLDIKFYSGGAFPAAMNGDAIISFHGSWDRTAATGYKVVRVPFGESGMPTGDPVPLLEYSGGGDTGSGWPHRPVGIETGVDGRLFVSSDASGIIIAIGYNGG